ncbi:MAG: GNAT family N-acetyltransferase [Nanoarchaeota archaeon]|nr:GNAT family N-acetyltransferase [Nanoarchaeota archaeon]
MSIRKATIDDFEELYKIGSNTPEFRVSASEAFMDPDDFKWHITNDKCVFLLAEEKDTQGFICAHAKDLDRGTENKYACLVYLTVVPEYRGRGIAKELYSKCEDELKDMGITHMYGWANAEGNAILKFMNKQGYDEGHRYVWVDKKL